MFTSPKRYILTNSGEVLEAAPGVSGTLIVGEGGQISEDDARKYGLLAGKDGEKAKAAPPAEPLHTSPIDSKAMRKKGGLITQAAKTTINEAGAEVPAKPTGGALPLEDSKDSKEKNKGLPKDIHLGKVS